MFVATTKFFTMKTVFTIFIIMLSVNSLMGQTEEQTEKQAKTYKNELGIDVTGTLKYFLSFNQGYPYEVTPTTYYLSYRRKFKPGNIRLAIGGNYQNTERAPVAPGVTSEYFYNNYAFQYRIGWEFTNTIGKRSQLYYGIDFRSSNSYVNSNSQNSAEGYTYGFEAKNQVYGFAPLLGYRIKLGSRISLTAETSLSFIWSKSNQKTYMTPTSSAFPAVPENVSPTLTSFYTSYSQPFSLVVTFDL